MVGIVGMGVLVEVEMSLGGVYVGGVVAGGVGGQAVVGLVGLVGGGGWGGPFGMVGAGVGMMLAECWMCFLYRGMENSLCWLIQVNTIALFIILAIINYAPPAVLSSVLFGGLLAIAISRNYIPESDSPSLKVVQVGSALLLAGAWVTILVLLLIR
jgi:hypothetical protein